MKLVYNEKIVKNLSTFFDIVETRRKVAKMSKIPEYLVESDIFIDYLYRSEWFKVLGEFNPKNDNIYFDKYLVDNRTNFRKVIAHEFRHKIQKILGKLSQGRKYLEKEARYTELYFC